MSFDSVNVNSDALPLDCFFIAGSGDSVPRKLTENEYFEQTQVYMSENCPGWKSFQFAQQGHYFPKYRHPFNQDPRGYEAEEAVFQQMTACNLSTKPFVLFNPCYNGVARFVDGFWKAAMSFGGEPTDAEFLSRATTGASLHSEMCDFIILDPQGVVVLGEIKSSKHCSVVKSAWKQLRPADFFIRKVINYLKNMLRMPNSVFLPIIKLVVLPNHYSGADAVSPRRGESTGDSFIFHKNHLSDFLRSYKARLPPNSLIGAGSDEEKFQLIQALLPVLVNLQISTSLAMDERAFDDLVRQQYLTPGGMFALQERNDQPHFAYSIQRSRKCIQYSLTFEQYNYVHSYLSIPLAQLLGAPGTGKTLVMQLRMIELMKHGISVLCICPTLEVKALYERFFTDHLDHYEIAKPEPCAADANLTLMKTDWFHQQQRNPNDSTFGINVKPAVLALWHVPGSSFRANDYHNRMQAVLSSLGYGSAYAWMLDESPISNSTLIDIARMQSNSGCWIVPFTNNYGRGTWNRNPAASAPNEFVQRFLSKPLRYSRNIHSRLGELFSQILGNDDMLRPLEHLYDGPAVQIVNAVEIRSFRDLAIGIINLLQRVVQRHVRPGEAPGAWLKHIALLLPRTGQWQPFYTNALMLLDEVRRVADSWRIAHVPIADYFVSPNCAVTIDSARNAPSFEWRTVISVVDDPESSTSENMHDTVTQYANTSLTRAVFELIEVRINLGGLME